jgi:hypothetical protein
VEPSPYLFAGVFGCVEALILLALQLNLSVGHVCEILAKSVSARQ